MDAWPTFWKHNKPLYDLMIAKGFKFKHDELSHFVDSDDNYVAYPAGYITGVGYNDNGTPTPFYASINLGEGNGILQRSFKTRQETVKWAFTTANA